MPDHPNPVGIVTAATRADPVGLQAGAAMASCVRITRSGTRPFDAYWVTRLCEACLDAAPDAQSDVLDQMRQAGLSVVDIAETYVPAAARSLGDQWREDETSFASVTIGCSRLHGVLRDLSSLWWPTGPIDPMAPSILVLVSEDSDHTLGATVLSGMLRRTGCSVRLTLGARAEQVAELLKKSEYEAVLISASNVDSIETVRKFVRAAKSASPVSPSVIVGGTITTDGTISAEKLLSETGADYSTNDPYKAIELCRRMAPPELANGLKQSAPSWRN